MKNTVKGARVYRFGETVAINIKMDDHLTETFYLPARVADALGDLLLDASEDCRIHPFAASRFGTMLVTEDGRAVKE